MFTLAQIEAAHSNVESGSGFPAFAKAIRELGVRTFETFVEDGSATYKGEDGAQVSGVQKYAPILIYGVVKPDKFLSDLRNHQQGNTDFFQFCKDCADSGIFKWTVDLDAKTCNYYDAEDNAVYEEKIPG